MFCFSTISFSIKVKEKKNFSKPDVIIDFYFYWQEACLPTIAQVKLASNVVKFLPTRYNQNHSLAIENGQAWYSCSLVRKLELFMSSGVRRNLLRGMGNRIGLSRFF